MLLHLNEIERRRLHLKQAYKSMFDYCTTGLGYSASAASRRIRTARCVARFPEVYGMLERNDVNVSTISQVARILTPENKDKLLSRIQGKSQREVDAVVAEYQPRVALPPDRVRTVFLQTPNASADVVAGSGAAASAPTHAAAAGASPSTAPGVRPACGHDRSGREYKDLPDTRAEESACPEERPTRPERHVAIQFTASEAFLAKVEQARSLVWHRLPNDGSFEQLFELALDLLIERESAAARHKRRNNRRTTGTAPKTRDGSRHIPQAVRDAVFVRDKGGCTFRAGNRRCASTTALQVDHIKPFALGGTSTPDNLRLLCAYHNQLEAERVLGHAAIVSARSSLGPPAT